jgi:hypothetical protein
LFFGNAEFVSATSMMPMFPVPKLPHQILFMTTDVGVVPSRTEYENIYLQMSLRAILMFLWIKPPQNGTK